MQLWMLQVTNIKQLCQSIAQCVQLLVKYFELGSFTSHLVKIDAAKQWRFSWKSKWAQDQCSVDIVVGSICIGSGTNQLWGRDLSRLWSPDGHIHALGLTPRGALAMAGQMFITTTRWKECLEWREAAMIWWTTLTACGRFLGIPS